MKKNKNRIGLIILCIMLLMTTVSYGAKLKLPEQSYDFYVYDESSLLNNNIKDYIIDVNLELYEKTGAQIVVATVETLQDLDIQSYSLQLYEKWEIGSKKYDNGMLILIAPNEGEIWIEMGYGLEGQFPDSKTKKIIRDHMIPSFSEGEFSEGVEAGFNQILIEVEKEYDIVLSKAEGIQDTSNLDDDRIFFPNVFMIIGIIVFIFIDFKFFRGMMIYSILRGFGRGGGSGGYRGSSGGGRSSGGGGRSGGGGAGGKW